MYFIPEIFKDNVLLLTICTFKKYGYGPISIAPIIASIKHDKQSFCQNFLFLGLKLPD